MIGLHEDLGIVGGVDGSKVVSNNLLGEPTLAPDATALRIRV